MNKKKYILKPGKHQFAPCSPAVHNNDNLSDEEAQWYLEKYPHINVLFEDSPVVEKSGNSKGKAKSYESQNQPVKDGLPSYLPLTTIIK